MSETAADKTITLFNRNLLSDPGSRGFTVQWRDQVIQGFVVCRQQQLYAYLNSCPHTGAPLDWVDHQFLDVDHCYIQCSTHDARFEIDTGRCVAGPCVDAYLRQLRVETVGDQVVLRVA